MGWMPMMPIGLAEVLTILAIIAGTFAVALLFRFLRSLRNRR